MHLMFSGIAGFPGVEEKNSQSTQRASLAWGFSAARLPVRLPRPSGGARRLGEEGGGELETKLPEWRSGLQQQAVGGKLSEQ